MTERFIEEKIQESHHPIVRIHRYGDIRKNCAYFQKLARERGRESGFVLKSNAYGFGLEAMTSLLSNAGVKTVFTSDEHEGEIIRKSSYGREMNIYALHGFNHRRAEDFLGARITPVLNSLSEIESYVACAREKKMHLPAAVQFDTGMNRCGLTEEEVQHLKKHFNAIARHVDINLLLTHFYHVEEECSAAQEDCKIQIKRMNALSAYFPSVPVSMTATHGTVYVETQAGIKQDIDRVGIGLYGGRVRDQPFCLDVYARLRQIKFIKSGETIGYDGAYRAGKDMRIGVVDIGYGDGYPRLVGDGTVASGFVFVHGMAAPLLGKVAMNAMCIDLSTLPPEQIQVGDYIQVVGPDVDLRHLAHAAQTVPEDIMISLNHPTARAQTCIYEGVSYDQVN